MMAFCIELTVEGGAEPDGGIDRRFDGGMVCRAEVPDWREPGILLDGGLDPGPSESGCRPPLRSNVLI
jgi:hypothetical protein